MSVLNNNYYNIPKDEINEKIDRCHQSLSYWENSYRNTKNSFYKKSYLRQINRYQATLEILEWIKKVGENNDKNN